MRVILILLLCCLSVLAGNKNKEYLTESMGQEVIEIGAPLKELPDLEEEPSAESDDVTSTTIQVATQRETKKIENIETVKAVTKMDAQKDDEEARIEKELADIYKDSLDYKADSGEVTKDSTETNATEPSDKPIARARKKPSQQLEKEALFPL